MPAGRICRTKAKISVAANPASEWTDLNQCIQDSLDRALSVGRAKPMTPAPGTSFLVAKMYETHGPAFGWVGQIKYARVEGGVSHLQESPSNRVPRGQCLRYWSTTLNVLKAVMPTGNTHHWWCLSPFSCSDFF